jgi:uncharacterized protein
MTDEQMTQSGDDERLSRLGGTSAIPPSSNNDRIIAPTEDAASDDVVEEYEDRYFPQRGEKLKRAPRSYSTVSVSDDERLWAAVAHASAWVTALVGLVSFGFLIPLSIFIPLVIYFMFRRRSDYVAFHALQAFVLQLLGTVGAFAILMVGGVVWGVGMVVSLLAMALLVGFLLVPVWGLVGIAFAVGVIALPIAMLIYGTMAAIATYRGQDYRYPYIAQWVDRQLSGGLLNPS